MELTILPDTTRDRGRRARTAIINILSVPQWMQPYSSPPYVESVSASSSNGSLIHGKLGQLLTMNTHDRDGFSRWVCRSIFVHRGSYLLPGSWRGKWICGRPWGTPHYRRRPFSDFGAHISNRKSI